MEAALSDAQRVQDQLDLPLAGVPFAIGENFDFHGSPTTLAGVPGSSDPDISATLVAQLIAAGGILVGKFVTSPAELDLPAVGPDGTPIRSVCAPDSPGGMVAAGGAVAVGSCQVCFSVATDPTGSGQVAAALNHVTALKPTRGVVPMTGIRTTLRSIECALIFGKCVADCATILDVLVEEDIQDPWSRKMTPAARFAHPARFGVPLDGQVSYRTDSDSEAAYQRVVEKLPELGGVCVSVDIQPLLRAAELVTVGASAVERISALDGSLAHLDEQSAVAAALGPAREITAMQVVASCHEREHLRKRTRCLWREVDAIVLPTVPTLDLGSDTAASATTGFINVLDLASITIPVGFRADGLPLGLTLVGPSFSDWELRRLAKLVVGESLRVKTSTPPAHAVENDIDIVITGTYLSGGALNHALTSRRAIFRESVETAPDYALFALETAPPKSGLVNVGSNSGVSIEAEVWSLTPEAFASLVDATSAPICIGTVRLKDGRELKGFLCEEHATRKAIPISAYGSWREYLNSVAKTS